MNEYSNNQCTGRISDAAHVAPTTSHSDSEGDSVEADSEDDAESTTHNPIYHVTGPSSHELESFRNEWRQELQQRSSPRVGSADSSSSKTKHTVTMELKSATERHVTELQQFTKDTYQSVLKSDSNLIGSLIEHFQQLAAEDVEFQYFPKLNESVQRTHISNLPMEMVLMILRYALGDCLDYWSLFRTLSLICKGGYMIARDESHWRYVAYRLWGITKGSRHMVFYRAHPLFHGVYISRSTYVRIGEPEINRHYPPCYLIEYYRYIRFFPPTDSDMSGKVVMLTSNDSPEIVLPGLMQQSQLIEGTYDFDLPNNDHMPCQINCVFQTKTVVTAPNRASRRLQVLYVNETKCKNYICDFELCHARCSYSNKLSWQRYEIHQYSSLSKDVQESDFNVSDKKSFPLFRFYPMKLGFLDNRD